MIGDVAKSVTCLECSANQTDPGLTICEPCHRLHFTRAGSASVEQSPTRARRLALGLCTVCGLEPHRPERRTCKGCGKGNPTPRSPDGWKRAFTAQRKRNRK